ERWSGPAAVDLYRIRGRQGTRSAASRTGLRSAGRGSRADGQRCACARFYCSHACPAFSRVVPADKVGPVHRPDALHTLLVAAAREFNAGRYFEAHEVLEDGLEEVPDHMWNLFLGLIQIAVGYHKVTQKLWRGAAQMLSRALEKVEPFPPEAA